MSKAANYPLRLSRSIMQAAKETAELEGVSLNQFIATAVAEKLSALRAEDLLRDRARRGDWSKAARILDRTGTQPPRPGDEVD
ncbi:MAG: toxin-antitoxin system HicB family antitoxin [Alphaproteobacteria bacterium]|nr:toxin-antitoxin system HicB family antitoxin [Alphaproteobacteria bacterium]